MRSAPISFVKKHASLLFLFAVLSSSLSLNVVLALRLQQLTAIKTPTRQVGVRDQSVLASIPVVDADGARLSLGFGDRRPTVLYVLAPHCPWCERNHANISALALAKRADFNFIGLSNTETGFADYARSDSLPFPVFRVDTSTLLTGPTPELLRQLDPTPQLVVIAPGGRVNKVWVGAFTGQTQSDVERFFGAVLPGLTGNDSLKNQPKP